MTIRLHSAFNPAFQDAWHGFARLCGRFSVRCDGVFVFLCVSLRHEKSVACSSRCARHGGLPARRGGHCGSALADYAFSLAGCGALLPKFAPALRPFAGTPPPGGLHPAFPRGVRLPALRISDAAALPLRVKVVSVSLVWFTLSYATWAAEAWGAWRWLLLLLALGVSLHILRFPTLRRPRS